MLEVRFIDAFRRYGVSWKAIRVEAECAAEIVHDSYPFSTRRFKTDGRSIFAEIVQETGDESLLDLVKSQYELKSIVEPLLFEDLEFSALGIKPVRWWPLRMNRRAVIDPERSSASPLSTLSPFRPTYWPVPSGRRGLFSRLPAGTWLTPGPLKDAIGLEGQHTKAV